MEKKRKTSRKELQFIEVGIAVDGCDFYVVFAAPKGLVMRSYSVKSQSIEPLNLQDWLLSDFPVILSRRVMAKPGVEIKLVSYRPIFPGTPDFVPTACYPANSLADSWVNPFVNLFASLFVNNNENVSRK